MSGVIKNERVLRRIREQNAGDLLPLWVLYPMLPYPSCKAIIYCYFTVNVCNKRKVIFNISFVPHAAIRKWYSKVKVAHKLFQVKTTHIIMHTFSGRPHVVRSPVRSDIQQLSGPPLLSVPLKYVYDSYLVDTAYNVIYFV